MVFKKRFNDGRHPPFGLFVRLFRLVDLFGFGILFYESFGRIVNLT